MTLARLAVIDYDAGNLHSACKGLEYAGAEITMVASGADLSRFDGVVLPGDGAFDPAMGELRSRGLIEPIQSAIAEGQPFLGICIGLQLLFESSEEGEEPGLGIVPGRIKKFRSEPQIRIPHMGWTQLELSQPQHPLWRDLGEHPWAYFVHSYYGEPIDPSWIAATITHGSQTVAAAIGRDHLMATQFHPEKSWPAGLQMLKNFVRFVIEIKEGRTLSPDHENRQPRQDERQTV